jgi:CDP-diacylglycerol--glycerol-3-phosphate 3-phosphatidyltransferase
MYRQLPNLLTSVRAVLTVGFLLLLQPYDVIGHETARPWLLAATTVFIIAAATDWLDGYLARRWQVESTFGRVMDPLVDKVLVLGAFVLLAGPRFADPDTLGPVTGIAPWMVFVMLVRELLVTGIRGEFEGRGQRFGAKLPGKLKTTLQLVAVPAVLLFVWSGPTHADEPALVVARDVLVWATVLATVASGVPYVLAAIRSSRNTPG